MSRSRTLLLTFCVVTALAVSACASPITLTADTQTPPPTTDQTSPPTTTAVTAAKCDMMPPLPPEDETAPTDTPGVAPTPAQAQVFSTITQQTQQVRGLDGANVPIEMLAPEQVTATTERFRTERDKQSAAGLDPLAKQLGWVPESSTLEGESKALQAGLILGFYVPQAKKLWVVQRSDELSPLQQATVAHEWTHALQDANYDLTKLDDAVPRYDFDRGSALTSVLEGDASHTEEEWSLEFQSPEQRRRRLEEESSVDTGQIKMGPLLDDLLMPYQYGPAFISAVMPTGGTPPLSAVFADLPRTTTEILHPELYTNGFERTEIGVEDYGARLGDGWNQKMVGTWGEYSTANVLSGLAGVPGVRAGSELPNVEGWLGDCLGFWVKDTGRFGAISTKWDSAATAAKFADRVDTMLDKAGAQAAADGFRQVDPQHLWKIEQSADTTTLLFTNDAGAAAAAGTSSGGGRSRV